MGFIRAAIVEGAAEVNLKSTSSDKFKAVRRSNAVLPVKVEFTVGIQEQS